MNKNMSAHLSNETFVRWQMGDVTEAERTHVAECPECQAQAKPLEDALSWFGAAARQWGEERATLVQERHESSETATRGWRMATAWALVSVTLLLLFAIGVPRWKAHQAAIEAQVQRRQQAEKQELALDNTLLEEVDQDVSQEVPEAMQALSWNTANGTAASGTGDKASRQ